MADEAEDFHMKPLPCKILFTTRQAEGTYPYILLNSVSLPWSQRYQRLVPDGEHSIFVRFYTIHIFPLHFELGLILLRSFMGVLRHVSPFSLVRMLSTIR